MARLFLSLPVPHVCVLERCVHAATSSQLSCSNLCGHISTSTNYETRSVSYIGSSASICFLKIKAQRCHNSYLIFYIVKKKKKRFCRQQISQYSIILTQVYSLHIILFLRVISLFDQTGHYFASQYCEHAALLQTKKALQRKVKTAEKKSLVEIATSAELTTSSETLHTPVTMFF